MGQRADELKKTPIRINYGCNESGVLLSFTAPVTVVLLNEAEVDGMVKGLQEALVLHKDYLAKLAIEKASAALAKTH